MISTDPDCSLCNVQTLDSQMNKECKCGYVAGSHLYPHPHKMNNNICEGFTLTES